MHSNQSSYIAIGRVGRPHGIKGAFHVRLYGDDASFPTYDTLLLPDQDGILHEYEVISSRIKKPGVAVVQLKGLNDRNQAEELTGSEVFVDEAWLAEPSDDETYWYQLEGMRVVTDDGREIGRITGILETAAHDIYVVRGEDGREVLVPAVAQIVKDIDTDAGICTISPPPGLLEVNAD